MRRLYLQVTGNCGVAAKGLIIKLDMITDNRSQNADQNSS
jgi:hypothetical protein